MSLNEETSTRKYETDGRRKRKREEPAPTVYSGLVASIYSRNCTRGRERNTTATTRRDISRGGRQRRKTGEISVQRGSGCNSGYACEGTVYRRYLDDDLHMTVLQRGVGSYEKFDVGFAVGVVYAIPGRA